jgi:uncharacterized damage-inducible protein DinB
MELGAVCVLNLRFMQWADERILEAVSQLDRDQALADRGSSFGGILGTLQHIYRSERAWLTRLTTDPNAQTAGIDAPPDPIFLKTVWPPLHRDWISWAESIQDWEALQTHTNQKGEAFQLPRWQIVLHVINHASYHRGQVVTMLRQAGAAPPPSTDLIAFYRASPAFTRSQASQS